MLPSASEFFKEQTKSANIAGSVVTMIARIMDDYAELKVEEYKHAQDLREFYEEDVVKPAVDDWQSIHHFQNENTDDSNPDGPTIYHFPDP
jgi:hypothetical protein